MTRLLLVVLASSTFSVVCVLACAGFIFVREWWWNRDRRRRVMAMLHQERAIEDAAAFLADQMAVQLQEIQALPEVFKNLADI